MRLDVQALSPQCKKMSFFLFSSDMSPWPAMAQNEPHIFRVSIISTDLRAELLDTL
jgi:hypothetical protein